MTINHKLQASGHSSVSTELSRFDRIRLHLRCLLRDHKYRWHLAGVWRELLRQWTVNLVAKAKWNWVQRRWDRVRVTRTSWGIRFRASGRHLTHLTCLF